jgi:hypothetical protein
MKTYAQQKWENQTAKLWPCLKGSLAKVYKPCIRTNCPACRSGRKHSAWILSYTDQGKRRCLYVPLEMVKTVALALKNGRRLEQLLFQTGPQLVKHYRQSAKSSRKTPRKS